MNNKNLQGWFLNQFKESINRYRESFFRVTDQSDKIIVWLVGFSIASIALTLEKRDAMNVLIGNFADYIFIFGSITIITGVLYRVFLFIAQSLEINILIAFESYIEGYNNPPNIHIGRSISENDTYDEIVDFIQEDFGVEIDRFPINILTPDQLKPLRDSIVTYYSALNKWENQKFESAINEIKDILHKNLGYSKKRLEKVFDFDRSNSTKTKLFWIFNYTASVLFLLSCLTFASGIIVILIGYFNKISS